MKRKITDIADTIGPEALVDLADGLRLGVVIVSSDGTISEVSPPAAGIFRPKTNIFEIIASPADLRAQWEEVPLGDVNTTRISVISSGRRHWLDTVMMRLSGEHTMFVFRDVTIKLDAQEELLRERAFYRSLLGQLGVGLMLVDPEMHVLWVNDVAANMLSKPLEPGTSRCTDLLSCGEAACRECPAVKTRETGETSGGEVRIHDTKEGERILHIVAAPIKDYRGRVEQMSLVLEDVTEKKTREDEYRERLEKEVELKTRDLEVTNRRLRMLDRMKEEFLANITHELRTPLVSGIGYIELMLQGGAGVMPPGARDGLEISHKNLLRLVGLIEDLLTYTRLSAGHEEIQREAVDISRMVRECASDLSIRSAGKRDLQVSLEMDEEPRVVWVDADKIYRVIANLLANAEKFTGEGAKVLVKVHRVGGEVEVSVEDNGPGIPDDERELVFEHFQRGSVAKKGRSQGAGIGLSLVRQILEAHNSRIEVRESTLGGAAMVFRLPAVGAGGVPETRVSAEPATVLIADNDAEVSGLLRVALEDVGYRVYTETISGKVMPHIKGGFPDVVVLDCDVSGTEALNLLTDIRALSNVPVIAMCGACTPETIEKLGKMGAEVLRKPFPIASLTGLVGKMSKRKGR
jgi:signal transduction histidine kinase